MTSDFPADCWYAHIFHYSHSCSGIHILDAGRGAWLCAHHLIARLPRHLNEWEEDNPYTLYETFVWCLDTCFLCLLLCIFSHVQLVFGWFGCLLLRTVWMINHTCHHTVQLVSLLVGMMYKYGRVFFLPFFESFFNLTKKTFLFLLQNLFFSFLPLLIISRPVTFLLWLTRIQRTTGLLYWT